MLTLLISTKRRGRQVLANLSYLAALAGDELHLIISDCSADPGKRAYLQKLAGANPHIELLFHEQPVALYTDIAELITARTERYDYVAICGDDDYVSWDYLSYSVAALAAEPTAVGSYGNYLICRSDRRVSLDTRSILADSSAARIAQHFNPNLFNTIFFAVFRRSALLPWAAFCRGHPLTAGFFDFIHCLSLLAQGKIIAHDHGYYLWTGENWDTPERNAASRRRHYQSVGVSEDFSLFHDLHFAVECANFLLGSNSPLPDTAERRAAAQMAWERCLQRFYRSVAQRESAYRQLLADQPTAGAAFQALLANPSCHDPNVLRCFTAILAAFSPNIAERYQQRFAAAR